MHPEYMDYQRDLWIFRRLQQAAKEWEAGARVIVVNQTEMQWTYAQAQECIRSISCLFQEYNRILWNQFPYCDQCRGQCCGVKASGVHPVDLFALAMLGRTLPLFASQIQAAARDCIYITDFRCSWPAEWKTVKCWLFYCLGCGDWELSEPVSMHYNQISRDLEQLIQARLPDALRNYERHSGDRLIEHLIDPLSFANAFCCAMQTLFIEPFMKAFFPGEKMPTLHGMDEIRSDNLISSGGVHAFIAEVAEEIELNSMKSSPGSNQEAGQVLEDLEELEMIALGHPGNEKRLLTEMYARYSHAARLGRGKRPSIAYRMRVQIQQLLNSQVGPIESSRLS